MAIHPSQILFYAGGRSLELFGTPSRRVAPIARRGEDIIETFTRASTGTYIDANGEVKLAEVDALRVDMLDLDVAGVFDVPAIRLEDTRDNDFTFAEQLDNAVWTKTRATASANAATAPDGKTTADKLVEDGTASITHLFSRNTPALTDDTQQAFSLFAKAAGRSEIRIVFTQKDGTDATVWFDLSAGTVGSVLGGAVGLIKKYADSWYRCMFMADSANGGTTPLLRIFMGSGGETPTYNGDSSSGVFFWGMDFEVDKASPSSYIATAGSTVTRAVDAMTFPYLIAPRNQSGYVRFVEQGTILGADGTRIFHVGDATAGGDPRMFIVVASNLYRFTADDGTNIATSTMGAAPSFGDIVELRFEFNKTAGTIQIHQSINGAAETSASAGSGLNKTLLTAWAGQILTLNANGAGTNNGFNKFIDIMLVDGTGHTRADFRKATQQ